MRDLNKEILVITSFLRVCKSDFKLRFTENDIEELFESKISYNDLNDTLGVLAENDVLLYTRGDEDGFAEGFDITIKKEKCFDFIQSSYITRHTELLNEINKQSEELKDIYGFLPDTIVQEINDSKTTLNDIVNSIKDSEFLKPLEPKIKEINDYLEKTENVIKNYENIYLNVIKPIKREGKQGIRATAIWAVASILITTVLSFYFSYKTFNKQTSTTELKPNSEYNQASDIKNQKNIDISALESKVNFLVREYVGLNGDYDLVKNSIEIKYLDEEVVFLSKSDTVIFESYAFNDYKTDSSCYSTADLRIYINDRMVTTNMLKETFIIKSAIQGEKYAYNQLKVIEGDTIIFNNNKIVIDNILSKDSECVPIGDKYNALIIRKIQ